jgi:hypothetical protein
LDLEEDAVAASWTVVDDRLARWKAGFDEAFALIAGRFAQADSRRRGRLYVLGLLSGAERKNSWTIAEQAGDLSPDGMQRLLNFYRWDADAVRDDLRGYVLDHLGDPAGVVVADETGFLKKGTKSAGVRASVLRHGWADRELPTWRVPHLHIAARAGIDRPRALSAEVLDRRAAAVRRGRDPQRR